MPKVPILVGKDRVKTAKEAITRHSVDTVLLDDGFQYRRLKRDLDILCIDATDPFGNGWMIPAGSMREGLWALKRADIFLITKVDLVQEKSLQDLEGKLKRINPRALVVKSLHKVKKFYNLRNGNRIDLGLLKNKEVILVSAIGNPASFERTILKLGLKVKKHFVFRDHYWYKKEDLKNIEDYGRREGIDTIITTEKDAVRLRVTSHESRITNHESRLSAAVPVAAGTKVEITNILVLSIKLEIIENEERFYNRLFGIYSS